MDPRAILLACLLPLAAGCLGDAAETTVPAAPAPLPFEAEGVAWLPDSTGPDRAETLLPFPVNATGMAIAATLRLGAFYGVEAPASIADVQVELRGPDGAVLDEATLRVDAGREAALEAEAAQAGEHVLAILSYGGGDGEAYGDYVAWRIEAA